MGIYIKGMDISEIEELVLTKNVQLVFCWTSNMTLTAKTKTESKDGIISYSKEFEVVEVHEPHGRLIEAPDVSEYEVLDEDTGTREIALLGLMECHRMVKDAETVIEAER